MLGLLLACRKNADNPPSHPNCGAQISAHARHRAPKEENASSRRSSKGFSCAGEGESVEMRGKLMQTPPQMAVAQKNVPKFGTWVDGTKD